MEAPRTQPHWLKRRHVLAGSAILVILLLATGWWWTNRSPDTILMEGAIVITQPDHYAVSEDGSCLGTRTGFMGGASVDIELDSGERITFEMEPGEVASGTCRLAFSGDVPVSETYTAHVHRYELATLKHNQVSLRVGEGETGETFLRADFIADPYDPWAAGT